MKLNIFFAGVICLSTIIYAADGELSVPDKAMIMGQVIYEKALAEELKNAHTIGDFDRLFAETVKMRPAAGTSECQKIVFNERIRAQKEMILQRRDALLKVEARGSKCVVLAKHADA